ncbi:MAG: cbb3-type cytochrome c oxidase N-terminal domain-containing protein [Thermodesulfobacteriota bacterium]|jgi:cytochrome c oxidase cbb3-type subunit 3
MSENEKDDLLIKGHDYDGIQELNNPLPGWWLMTFYITIVFAVVYYTYYTFFGGLTSDEELALKMSVIQSEQQMAEQTAPVKSEDYLIALLDNQEVLEKGKTEYMLKCMACHGDKGQGLIGPNFTDEYWIQGDGSVSAILEVANNGVLDKGMPPWKGVIPEDTLEAVSVYIYSLYGTNPDGARPPQGEKVERN